MGVLGSRWRRPREVPDRVRWLSLQPGEARVTLRRTRVRRRGSQDLTGRVASPAAGGRMTRRDRLRGTGPPRCASNRSFAAGDPRGAAEGVVGCRGELLAARGRAEEERLPVVSVVGG